MQPLAADHDERPLPDSGDNWESERHPVVYPTAVVQDRFRWITAVEELTDGVGSRRALRPVAEEDRRYSGVELAAVLEDLLVRDAAGARDRALSEKVLQAGVNQRLPVLDVLDHLKFADCAHPRSKCSRLHYPPSSVDLEEALPARNRNLTLLPSRGQSLEL